MGLLTINDLSGLGEGSSCGPKPGVGPGESTLCCPDLGWVIYDSSEPAYGLCERAAAKNGSAASSSPSTGTGPGAGASQSQAELARYEAERRAGEAKLEAQRKAVEKRRLALEDRLFQQRVQEVMLQARLKRAKLARESTPEARAARAAAAAAASERAKARSEAAAKKKLVYAALAAVAAKLFLFP